MKWLTRLLYLAVFVIGLALIVVGQHRIGPIGLLLMVMGLAGILLLLYLYNRKFQ